MKLRLGFSMDCWLGFLLEFPKRYYIGECRPGWPRKGSRSRWKEEFEGLGQGFRRGVG